MSLYYLILWNQVDILQKHFKKDHVHMRLWTRFYGIQVVYAIGLSRIHKVSAKKSIELHLISMQLIVGWEPKGH